jgi:hypothetical protein
MRFETMEKGGVLLTALTMLERMKPTAKHSRRSPRLLHLML